MIVDDLEDALRAFEANNLGGSHGQERHDEGAT